ncbi:MAG: hypothetical protein ACYDBH_01455 [Acidobacteriaceae bacterium]
MKPRTLFLALFVSLLFWVAVGYAVAHAAAPTRAQVKHAVDPAFKHRTYSYVPLAALAIAAIADVMTTRAAITRGCREANPIYGPHPSDPTLIATHALVIDAAWGTKAPPWVDYAGAAVFGAAAVHNATIRCRP